MESSMDKEISEEEGAHNLTLLTAALDQADAPNECEQIDECNLSEQFRKGIEVGEIIPDSNNSADVDPAIMRENEEIYNSYMRGEEIKRNEQGEDKDTSDVDSDEEEISKGEECYMNGFKRERNEQGEDEDSSDVDPEEERILNGEESQVSKVAKVKYDCAKYLNALSFEELMLLIITFLRTGELPERVRNGKPQERYRWRERCKPYTYDDVTKTLYIEMTVDKIAKTKRNLPVILGKKAQKREILRVHRGNERSKESSALGGHLGRNKCLSALRKQVYFDNMKDKIAYRISTCYGCQMVKDGSKLDKGGEKLQPIKVPRKIWSQIGIDLVTNMKETEDGYNIIATAVDYMSKWVELEPMKDRRAVTIAAFLFKLMCRYGKADIHITDQGKEFCNRVSDAFYELSGTRHRVTSAYHPQANGLVERQNRTTQEALQKCKEDYVHQEEQEQEQENDRKGNKGSKQSRKLYKAIKERTKTVEQEVHRDPSAAADWFRRLPSIAFAVNSRRHETTGFSPYRLMFGREPLFPGQPDDPFEDQRPEMSIAETVEFMENVRHQSIDIAGGNIEKSQARQKKNYDKKREKNIIYPIGSKVARRNKKDEYRHEKGTARWTGWYTVEKHGKRGGYYLRNKNGKLLKQCVPGNHLKQFYEEDSEVDDCSDTEETVLDISQVSPDTTDKGKKKEKLSCSQSQKPKPPVPAPRKKIKISKPARMPAPPCGTLDSIPEESMFLPQRGDGIVGDVLTEAPNVTVDISVASGQIFSAPIASSSLIQEEDEDASSQSNIKQLDLSVQIVSELPAAKAVFKPISLYYRIKIAKSMGIQLGITRGLPMSKFDHKGVKNECKGPVQLTVRATPDGNCFFNSLSYLLVANESQQHVIRQAICNYIRHPGNWNRLFFLLQHYGSGERYVRMTKMYKDRTWATDVETWAFAQMTNKDVLVYTKYNTWHRYNANYGSHGFGKLTSDGFYLDNSSGVHYDPVLHM